MSLSSWRAWIEISAKSPNGMVAPCRSPHGERGLKCFDADRHVLETAGRSPHGERGLKLFSAEDMEAFARVALLMESVD